MDKVITFTDVTESDLELPISAEKMLPDWYKNTGSYIGGNKIPIENGKTPATIKRCFPVFDALTSGYLILSPADVYVSIQDEKQYFQWTDYNLITFHPIIQAANHPNRKPFDYPKWTNPWAIKTPKGYSTFFTHPMHRESEMFTTFPGIVDTDRYTSPVNFPFVINDPQFEGLIPKGTPIAQVIPFKRDSWVKQKGSKKENEEQKKLFRKLRLTFFDSYKNQHWVKKSYK